jgi:signal transduction histidine kinase
MNLIDNSLRHGESVKAIRLWHEDDGEELRIYYEDDGIGIPQDMRDKLFRRGQGRNTGFGLFLSKEILDLTRISISETGDPGRGALFQLKVPKGIYRFAK